APGEQAGGELGGGCDQVLAVVEDEEQVTRADRAGQRLDWIGIAGQREAKAARDRRGDQRRICQRRELDEPHLPVLARRGLERQARLAAATGSRDRQQPRAAEVASDLPQLALAADEARQRERER